MCKLCIRDRPKKLGMYGRANRVHLMIEKIPRALVDDVVYTTQCDWQAIAFEHRHITENVLEVTCSKCLSKIGELILEGIVPSRKQCNGWKRYKAMRKPKCNCGKCLAKWERKQKRKSIAEST